MGEPIAPTSLEHLREWIQAGRLDALAVRGWLVQGYRVLTQELSFEDYLAGVRAILDTGHRLSPGDYRWLVALAAALEYFHLRTDQAAQLLSLEPPAGLNDHGELDGLVPSRSVLVAHWLGRYQLVPEPNHELDITWLDLPEVESVVGIGLVDPTLPRWHWLSDAVNNPMVEPAARLTALREVGVRIVDLTPLINAGAVSVLKVLLVGAAGLYWRNFWQQWLSSFALREGVVGHLMNLWVGAALAPLSPPARYLPRPSQPQLPPVLEARLWGRDHPRPSRASSPVLEDGSGPGAAQDPVQLYRQLSVADPLDVSWDYHHLWRVALGRLTDRNALDYLLARAHEYLQDRDFRPLVVPGSPAFNDVIIAMLHQRRDELTAHELEVVVV